jgi:hypothetical protein
MTEFTDVFETDFRRKRLIPQSSLFFSLLAGKSSRGAAGAQTPIEIGQTVKTQFIMTRVLVSVAVGSVPASEFRVTFQPRNLTMPSLAPFGSIRRR